MMIKHETFPEKKEQNDAEEPFLKIQPKISLKFSQETIRKMLYCQNYFIFECPSYILVYNIYSKQKVYFKVAIQDYFLVPFIPHIFACVIGQFLYFYSEDAMIDTKYILKAKISKLNVRSICSYKNGYFMGGYNRTPLPGGKLIDKRSIYYLQDISTSYKNKPITEINIPKNSNPISRLQMQSPYLMCYCEPNLYIINPFQKTILLSLNKQITYISMIEGRFATSCLNMIGISASNSKILTADLEKYPIYGVEINEFEFPATSICQSKDGRIFAAFDREIYSFDPLKNCKHTFKKFGEEFQLMEIFCTSSNNLVVLLKNKVIELQQPEQQCKQSCCLQDQYEKDQTKSSESDPNLCYQADSWKQLSVKYRQPRFVEVFNIDI